MSMHELTEVTGAYGKVNHGGAVANWEAGRNIPSEEQYNKMRDALIATGKIGEMPTYQDVVRPMSLSNDVEYTDVWDFPSVRPFKGKHPAENRSICLSTSFKLQLTVMTPYWIVLLALVLLLSLHLSSVGDLSPWR